MARSRPQGATSRIARPRNGVDDVLHCTIRILEALLRRLQPVPPVPADFRVPPPPAPVPSESLRERPLWLAMYGIDIRPCPGCGLGRIV
ncbi:hypothetical protein OVA20_22290 [Streptomyces sp. SL294]|uniref:hypothetical protein n=1 Tax=Streptomyces sp. SL294 TaxID=2995144 RepID=UPI002272FFE4|nr:MULTISPECIES: hypothetical protein [unclassified Streptomyces]MCY1651647.1 hypothetical protein [Streptomyces sp. SL203]MCY1681169.1 hypothetical protein [Streptomyces sp. SL294]